MAKKKATRNGAEEELVFPASRRPRVLLLGDPSKPRVQQLAQELKAFLPHYCDLVGVELARRLEPITAKVDLIVVLGGDGALLATSYRLGRRSVPVMGVNFGTVGFLATVPPDRAQEMLVRVLDGQGKCENHAMMRATVQRNRHVALDTHILNEVAILRAWGESMVEVDLTVNRRSVCTYRGDGVIVSTATGSTAYSLAAGGPILSPRLDAWVVTPVAPYMLGMRSLVLPGQRIATLRVRREAGFTADGHEEFHLQPGDQIRVSPSPRIFRLVVDPADNFYARLRSKLHWAEAPGPG